MSDKSQKNMQRFAVIALAILGVVFAALFFTGKLDGFLGVTEDSSAPSVPQSSIEKSKPQSVISSVFSSTPEISQTQYRFRNSTLLNQHYEKHGKEMGFASAEEYEKAAAAVPNNPAALHKTEKEDGDDVYYIESTNEFVVVSTDGYIRTYFNPDRGIDYFNKQ